MNSVIGLDLSGLSHGAKGSTVLTQMTVSEAPRVIEQHELRRGARTDSELLEWVRVRSPSVVAIDAPLSLPHAIACREPACDRCDPASPPAYLSRDIDARVGGMPTVMIAAIAFRGMYLAARLRELGMTVIEVYPAAAYASYGMSRADRRDPTRVTQELQRRAANGDFTTSDSRDSIAAALVAVEHALGTATSIRGLDGTIWLPGSGQSEVVV